MIGASETSGHADRKRTANLVSKLIVDRDAFTHEEQEEIKDALRRVENAMDDRHPELIAGMSCTMTLIAPDV